MKRVLVIALAMVFCLSAVAMATGPGPGPFYGKDAKVTPVSGDNGLVTLNISDVVYISFVQASGTGQGFTLADIDEGWATFPDIHRVKVSSTVNYLVAANLMNDQGVIGYSDVVLSSMSQLGSNMRSLAASANPDANRAVSDNLVFARARVASQASTRLEVLDGWFQIDTDCGEEYPIPPAREHSYQELFVGGPTSGIASGDQAWIDIGLDLAEARELGIILPSGRYTFHVDYLVVETDV